MKRFNAAADILRRVEVLYGADWGGNAPLKQLVAELRKKLA
jgi:hypothetical protein